MEPHIKSTDRFAFWTYDLYPFVLGSRIGDPDARRNRKARRAPFLILEGLEGAKLKADLEALREERCRAEKEMRRQFDIRLNLRLREESVRHPNPFVRARPARAQRLYDEKRSARAGTPT